MNYKQWTESPGNLWQRIKRISPKNWKVLGCKNSIKSEENGLVWYIKNNIETLLVAVRTSRTVTHKETETVDPKEFKKTREEQQKKKNGLQKECMDNLLYIWRTIKHYIDKTAKSPVFRICGTINETISRIVSQCGKRA